MDFDPIPPSPLKAGMRVLVTEGNWPGRVREVYYDATGSEPHSAYVELDDGGECVRDVDHLRPVMEQSNPFATAPALSPPDASAGVRDELRVFAQTLLGEPEIDREALLDATTTTIAALAAATATTRQEHHLADAFLGGFVVAILIVLFLVCLPHVL